MATDLNMTASKLQSTKAVGELPTHFAPSGRKSGPELDLDINKRATTNASSA
jgi:hypothetical protein